MKDFKYMSPRHLIFRNDWKCTLYGYAAKSIMPKVKITDDIVLDITVFSRMGDTHHRLYFISSDYSDSSYFATGFFFFCLKNHCSSFVFLYIQLSGWAFVSY